ncbi:MAG: ATP-dependent helicase, partial [Treponema sp.]|nr:ATP-dependent helicase [Treponema sp.]
MSNIDEYLSVLNPEQKEAVMHTASPLLILAGAGSGKTRVITTKIAYLISEKAVNPESILAVTFTKKAANEMKERAVALDERASYSMIKTFHSFGAWFLRRYALLAGLDSNFTVFDDDAVIALIKEANPNIDKKHADKYAKKIALAKDYCLTPDSPDLCSFLNISEEFRTIYANYEARKKLNGNVDFGDLILMPVTLMQQNAEVREYMHRRFRVVMVDEYQDSNIAQFNLLKLLSGVEENAGVYVCVVGDDDQSIYKFRGAEVQNILTFQDNFPNTKLIRLEKNYRSTSQILQAAESVVSHNEGRLGKNLTSMKGNGSKPTLVFLDNQFTEARFCADLIEVEKSKKNVPYNNWAILYRTNAQSLLFETEFLHRKIPYVIVGSLKFYEREEIKDAVALLSLVANPKNEVAFRRIINKPVRGIGKKSQDNIITAAFASSSNLFELDDVKLTKKALSSYKDFCTAIKDSASLLDNKNKYPDKNLSKFVKAIIEKTGIYEYHNSHDMSDGTRKVSNLEELENSAILYPLTMSGLVDFLDHIELDRTLESENDNDKPKDFVTLITLHNTKGLEYNRVIITGMEEGIFPREDKIGEELEEERRLLYVGITRAKDALYFTSCRQRSMYGNFDVQMQISPFLLEIDRNNLRVLGTVPYAFSRNDMSDSAMESLKWKCGIKVHDDEYGDGYIEKAYSSPEGEWVI